MAGVFADAAFWIAVSLPNDQWHDIAVAARSRLGEVELVTTDEVLTEFMTALSKQGVHGRRAAVAVVHHILRRTDVHVLPQTRDSFLSGLARYEQRLDKGYSLPDGISMNVMESEGITEVLTSDHNFEQEGFTILMKLDS